MVLDQLKKIFDRLPIKLGFLHFVLPRTQYSTCKIGVCSLLLGEGTALSILGRVPGARSPRALCEGMGGGQINGKIAVTTAGGSAASSGTFVVSP